VVYERISRGVTFGVQEQKVAGLIHIRAVFRPNGDASNKTSWFTSIFRWRGISNSKYKKFDNW
jgi:hypothetical protein